MAKILLADDSTRAQRMGTEILTGEGFEVTTVGNGQAAIKALKDFVPDLIVADIFMPGRNGYELCTFVKSDPKLSNVPVVLIVSPMEPYDPEEGRKARADAVVTKPLESSDLVATVHKLLAAAASAAVPAPKPAEEPEAEEPAYEEPEHEQTPKREEYEIPPEAAGQPLSVFEDLLESPVESPPAKPVAWKTSKMAAVSLPQETAPEEPAEDASLLSPSAPEVEEPGIELPQLGGEPGWMAKGGGPESEGRGGVQSLEVAEESAAEDLVLPPPSVEAAGWTAEAVPVTPEDEKLFEPRSADWAGLTKMVEEDEGESALPLPVPGEQSAAEPISLPEPGLAEPAAPAAASETESLPQTAAKGPPAALAEEVAEIEAMQQTPPQSPAPQTVAPSSPVLPSPNPAPPPLPIDRAAIEELVRQAMEEKVQQIVDRVVQSLKGTPPGR